jgi:hypothetical protein
VPPPSGVPRTQSQPRFSKAGPRERLFFSLILALFSFGATVDFWEATSAGDGLVMFILASALLFAIARLYHRRISQFLSAIHLSRPRPQLWATIGAIVLILVIGKITYTLHQSSAPSPRQLSASHPSAIHLPSGYQLVPEAYPAGDPNTEHPSRSVPDSGANTSSSLSAEQVIPVSLPNGTEILKMRRNDGHGKFTVDNGTAEDAVVELVNVETKKAIRAFYVESGKKFTEDHIGSGTYSINYMTGVGWDASARQFSRRGECGIFDQPATYSEQRNGETGEIDYHEFSITLQPVAGGTARTSALNPDEFSSAMAGVSSQ